MFYQGIENDWKLFKKRLPIWQENYMDKLTKEYAAILTGPGLSSERFWKVYDRYKEDLKSSGVIVHNKSRSTMLHDILNMLETDAISLEDLDGFSSEMMNTVYNWMALVGRGKEAEAHKKKQDSVKYK